MSPCHASPAPTLLIVKGDRSVVSQLELRTPNGGRPVVDTFGGRTDAGRIAKLPNHPPHADISQLAHSIVESATNETDDVPASAAVKRGRLGGAKGGVARAAALMPEQRSKIARKAAKKRWKKPD